MTQAQAQAQAPTLARTHALGPRTPSRTPTTPTPISRLARPPAHTHRHGTDAYARARARAARTRAQAAFSVLFAINHYRSALRRGGVPRFPLPACRYSHCQSAPANTAETSDHARSVPAMMSGHQ